MTGKELIIYILKNDLENVEMFEDGKFKFLMDVEEASMKFDVGMETILAWYAMGFITGIEIGDKVCFPRNILDPRSYNTERMLK